METPNYYAIIPATIRYDSNLTANAKLLYGEITALSNKEGYCFASNRYFAELYNVSTKTISLWIKSLIDCGYLYSQIERQENSNAIDKRKLYIVDFSNVNTPLQKCKDPIYKNVNTPLQKCKDPIYKNVKDNNIKDNIKNNNIKDNKGNFSDSSSLLKQPVIEKPKKKRKTQKEKKLDMLYKKCVEYNVSDTVVDLLERFVKGLLDDNKRITEEKVDAILMRLSKVNEQQQIKAIKLSLEKAYYDIDPEWLRNKNNSYNGNGKCSKELAWRTHEEMEESEKKRQEFFEKVRNNDPSIHHF